jgi:hypothetical protein
MAQKGKRQADQKLLLALACGATVEAAARQAGVSESTVYRRLDDAEFRRQLQTMRGDMVQRASGMLTAASMESVKTLIVLQNTSTPPAVRLGAARSVLEIGIKLREVADLGERVKALEEQLSLAAPPNAGAES